MARPWLDIMGDILKTIKVPAQNDSPIFTIPYRGLIGTDTLKVKAGWHSGDVPELFRVKQCAIKLVTDGTVKNRNITFKNYLVNGDASIYSIYAASANVAASSTDYLALGQIYTGHTGGQVTPDTYGWKDLILVGDDYIELGIYNNAAGDAWQAWIQFEYLRRKFLVSGK